MRLHQPSSQGVYSPGVPGDGNGDVVGPVASTDGAIALWDGTGGNTLKDSNLVYSVATLSVPDGFTVSSAGSIALIGVTGIGAAAIANMGLFLSGTPGNSAGSTYGLYNGVTAASTTTAALYGFFSNIRTEAAAFTLTLMSHFVASLPTIGAGSSITTQEGFRVGSGMVGATNNYGFRGQLAAAAGRWNLYMDGSGQNYLAGVTGIGIAASSTAALSLAASTTGVASLRIPHGSAPSAPVDGDMWTTTAGLFVRINGSTVGPLAA